MKNKIKVFGHLSWSNKLFYLFNTVFWIVVLFIIIYPLYFVMIASVSDPNAVVNGEVVWWPRDFSLMGYKYIFEYAKLWRGYANTIINTTVGVVLALGITISAGYAMSRRSFIGKNFFSLYFVITMFFDGGLIATYLWIRNLGLDNTRAILIIMGSFSVWNMMLARTYIQTSIPEELYEAAVLDGATHFQYFTRVIVPLSKTIMSVLMIYYGVAHWNDYFTALVYIRNHNLLPLQTVLKEILATAQMVADPELSALMYSEAGTALNELTRIANVAKYCMIIVSSAPVVVLYICVQKYFEKGIMIGSLKG